MFVYVIYNRIMYIIIKFIILLYIESEKEYGGKVIYFGLFRVMNRLLLIFFMGVKDIWVVDEEIFYVFEY